MDLELIFSAAGMLAMLGWAALLLSPLIPVWSNRIAGLAVPAILAAVYIAIALLPNHPEGGFGSLEAVGLLFNEPSSLLAGWLHFLAFDLLVGAWICRAGRRENIPFGFVALTLPVTFLFGPAGYLAFLVVRAVNSGLGRNVPAT